MKVILFSDKKERKIDDVVSVDFVGDNGKFHILKNHDKLVSLLTNGDLKCNIMNGKDVIIKVISGLINIENNVINVFLTEYSGDIA